VGETQISRDNCTAGISAERRGGRLDVTVDRC
jgi:hypothetical protein